MSLSDTVGFIRDLPHTLVKAFAATLQEAADADLLLHVVDASSPVLAEQMVEVERVLTEIDAAGIPQILVYNKLDQLDEEQRPRVLVDLLELDGGRRVPRVFVSALRGLGLAELRTLVSEALLADGGETGSRDAASAVLPAHDDTGASAEPPDHDPIPASALLQRHA